MFSCCCLRWVFDCFWGVFKRGFRQKIPLNKEIFTTLTESQEIVGFF
jgi:hypothetical protein